MEKPEPGISIKEALWEVSVALFELRNAFMELSLALKDRQFETDLVRRKSAQETVTQLIQKVSSPGHPPS